MTQGSFVSVVPAAARKALRVTTTGPTLLAALSARADELRPESDEHGDTRSPRRSGTCTGHGACA